MLNKKRLAILCACALMVLCGTASAQDGPVGSLQMGYDSLSVMPAVSYAELRMTISGDDVYWQKRYEPGSMVSVSTGQLPDGNYKYEIIASPELAKAALAKASSNTPLSPTIDREEKARTYIQSGSFEVVNGEMQQNARKGTDPLEGQTANGE